MAPELNKNQPVSGGAMTTKGGRAFVTFLAGEGDYVKGVVGLAKGLRKVKSAYPLVVAVLPCVPPEHRRLLEEQGCLLKPVDPVQPPVMDRAELGWAHEHFAINYSKLRIWEFVEFSKMIYFDGDIQIYGNVDHLFDLSDGHLYAVLDCFCDWYHSPQYKVGYCQQSPNRVMWPSEMGPPPSLYFNAGMFVFEPNLSTYDDLLNALRITPPSSFAEQDLLNMFFKDIYKPIPPVYNLLLAMLWQHSENVELDQVKVVHFCATGSKPWRYTGEEENMKREDVRMLVEEWWNIYNDPSLDYKQPVLEAPSPETAESGSQGLLSRAVSGTEEPNLPLMAVA